MAKGCGRRSGAWHYLARPAPLFRIYGGRLGIFASNHQGAARACRLKCNRGLHSQGRFRAGLCCFANCSTHRRNDEWKEIRRGRSAENGLSQLGATRVAPEKPVPHRPAASPVCGTCECGTMIDAEDPIPPEGILLRDAFDYLFRAMTPNLADLQYQLNPQEKMGLNDEQWRQFRSNAWAEFDRAQRVANQRLRKWITDGAITAFVHDTEHDRTLRVTRDGWDRLGEFECGITANFVGPDDPLNHGPNTLVGGKRRPVFFIRGELEKLVAAEFGSPPAAASGIDRPPVVARANIPVLFQAWRQHCGDRIPSEKEDIAHMKSFRCKPRCGADTA